MSKPNVIYLCIGSEERKGDQQEFVEAVNVSNSKDAYSDNQLIEEQQKLFEQADQDYIDQIIQMSIVDQSQNLFLNLKNEQESSEEDGGNDGGNISPQSESQNIENVLMSQEDQQQKFDKYIQDEKEIVEQIEKMNQNITPSQIAIDAAQQYGGDPLDYCDICGEDRADHDVSKRNYLIPCESDGECSD